VSLLTLQQFGHGTGEVLNILLFRTGRPAAQVINSHESSAKGPALSCDSLAHICEADLTERKSRVLLSSGQPKPTAPRQLEIFHNNFRPVILRRCAIFCDFTRLRHILHAHFALIAHTSSVLC